MASTCPYLRAVNRVICGEDIGVSKQPGSDAKEIAAAIAARTGRSRRLMIALAGPPAAGKSTLALALVPLLPAGEAVVVPMDGFHYDDGVLRARGLANRKGAPETFDFGGLKSLLQRIRADDGEVAIPVFDRSMELARAAAAIVEQRHRSVVVEGNYLLLDEEPWRDLAALFDLTVFIDVPQAELDLRLVARWREHGREDRAARAWIDGNDIPNILRVLERRRPADLVVTASAS